VCVIISQENQIIFISRKYVPTQNVMNAYSFDMQLFFVWTGWEDNAYDTHIFMQVIDNSNTKFSKPPQGNYMRKNSCYCNYFSI